MSLNIPPGDRLPLSLTLADGATGKYPQAEVYSDDGTLLGTYDLAHHGSGFYANNAQTMPSGSEFVTAVYIVYDDAGHTIPSTTYERASDIFFPDTTVRGTDIVDGTVTVTEALRRSNAADAGKIVRTANRYAYKADDGVTTVFAFDDNDTERTPV